MGEVATEGDALAEGEGEGHCPERPGFQRDAEPQAWRLQRAGLGRDARPVEAIARRLADEDRDHREGDDDG